MLCLNGAANPEFLSLGLIWYIVFLFSTVFTVALNILYPGAGYG